MIAFGWDTGVPPTRLQRAARAVLVCSCAALAVGVVSTSRLAHRNDPPARFVAAEHPADYAAMAAAAVPPVVRPPVELIRDVKTVRTAASRPAAGRVVWMVVTAYCPCPKCCGKGATGITASGRPVTAAGGHFVAAPAAFAFNTRLRVPGYDGGRPVPVLDRGGAIQRRPPRRLLPDPRPSEASGAASTSP